MARFATTTDEWQHADGSIGVYTTNTDNTGGLWENGDRSDWGTWVYHENTDQSGFWWNEAETESGEFHSDTDTNGQMIKIANYGTSQTSGTWEHTDGTLGTWEKDPEETTGTWSDENGRSGGFDIDDDSGSSGNWWTDSENGRW